MYPSSACMLVSHLCLFQRYFFPQEENNKNEACLCLTLSSYFFFFFFTLIGSKYHPFQLCFQFQSCLYLLYLGMVTVYLSINQSIRSALHIQGDHKIMTNVQGKTTWYFSSLPNRHNLDFSGKAQKYNNAIICFICNSSFKGHYKRQSDIGYLTPRIWKQLFRSREVHISHLHSTRASSRLKPLFILLCLLHYSLLSYPRKPNHQPAFFQVLFRCLLVKPTQRELRRNAISRGPYEKWKESECYRNKAWFGSQLAFHVVCLHRQKACRGRNKLFLQVSMNTHYIICFSQVKIMVNTLNFVRDLFASMKAWKVQIKRWDSRYFRHKEEAI